MSDPGKAIAELRKGYDLSEHTLARLAGLSEETVRGVESGAPPTSWELSRLAAGLGVDAAALYAGRLGDPKRSTARFRAPLGATLSGLDARLLAVASNLGRTGGTLWEWLKLPPPLGSLREVKGVSGRRRSRSRWRAPGGCRSKGRCGTSRT